jgi:tRNA modification GTPase
LLSNERQHALVVQAIEALEPLPHQLRFAEATAETLSDAEFALSALAEAIGRTVSDDVLERIFSRFCVGK